MKLIDVLYYYYYLFYKKIWRDNDPHLTTVLSLGFIFSIIINGIIDLMIVFAFGVFLNKYQKIAIALSAIIIMYIIFIKNKRGVYIVKGESQLIYNHLISIVISISFLTIGLLFLFFKADIIRAILNL